MSEILVTGGAGFVGSNLCDAAALDAMVDQDLFICPGT
jgi:nucleoside-diphosphate-sugar epimerase